MTTSNSRSPEDATTLRQLARQLEHNSSARTAQIAGMVVTCVGMVSLIVLSAAGRNNTSSIALILAGLILFSFASRAANRTAIYRGTLTDRMLGAIADSESIPDWSKVEVAAEYVARGRVTVATLTEIDLLIAEQRGTARATADSTPGADRLLARYGKTVDTSGALDRSAR
ncbi:hypothetical protein [Burkholderia pseudomallei]|uniref:hypothetical protein n=1 Tax=Burkholderia pseudomallei TaxID=28450 RepID=UPI000536AD89|nr:hypothetical protein [Burkholderia pseudomallei]KGW81019.1 hypothetical protein Y048_4257 [Burkholderia pseudomallei MSHR456]MBF3522652.1 hypothetical protein [Burkholderia pseudomallei]